MLNRSLLLFVAGGLVAIARASVADFEVPKSLENTILETSMIAGSNSTTTLIHLGRDGVYTGLHQSRQWHFPGSGVVVVPNGRYEYTSDQSNHSGVLEVYPDEGDPSSIEFRFTTPNSGNLWPAFFSRFRIASSDQSIPVVNTSVRSNLRPGESLIAGLVVDEGRSFLVRVVGPTLDAFGRNGAESLAATLRRSDREVAELKPVGEGGIPAENFSKIGEVLGAFPLMENSLDLVFFGGLPPGVYTVESSNIGSVDGECLIEVYAFPL